MGCSSESSSSKKWRLREDFCSILRPKKKKSNNNSKRKKKRKNQPLNRKYVEACDTRDGRESDLESLPTRLRDVMLARIIYPSRIIWVEYCNKPINVSVENYTIGPNNTCGGPLAPHIILILLVVVKPL